MNILILNWRDIKHPLSGGAEKSLFEQAKFWKKKGAKVEWFASAFKGCKKKELIDGIKIIRSGSHHSVHLIAFYKYFRGEFGRPDVIIDSFHFVPFFTPLYCKNSKIVALINEPAKNAWFKNVSFPLNVVGYIMEPLFFLPYIDTIFITGSQSIKDELPSFGIKKEYINIVQHGITVGKNLNLIKKEKDAILIYLSQISPDKGIEDALQALLIVRNKFKKIKLWVLGKPRDEEYMKKVLNLVDVLKIKNSVIFWGFVSEGKKFELLSRAWILVHPSIREGWGLNVIESNYVGTPVVGYDVTGLKDSIRNNITGILTRNNYKYLAEGIIRILTDKKMYNRMSKSSIDWSKQFSWDKSGEKSWKIITNKISLDI